MSENADNLLKKLRTLHNELASINDDESSDEPIAPETIDALSNLVSDATAIVDRAKVSTESTTGASEHHDLNDRIVKFETDHPRVTRFLSQLTDMLAMMGI